MISKLLAHPLTRGLSVDDPRTTLLRRQIIASKPFLRQIYIEWYTRIAESLECSRHDVLELGSGAGFFKEYLPTLITSEVFETPGVDLVADACDLPFLPNSLDAIVMTDVFHHIPNVEHFITEATRCIRPGGRIVMIEPWRTPWSERIYTSFHNEPFVPDAGWRIPKSGPLSGANGALPWIVFERDEAIFANRFPQWRIARIEPLMPLAYVISGGVSTRNIMPGWLYKPLRAIEMQCCQARWAMFALIALERAA